MNEGGIGLWGMLGAAALVVLAVAISVWQNLGLGRSLIWAAVRAGVQLLIIGFALRFMLDPQTPLLLAMVWLLFMIGFGSWTARRRAPEVPGMAILAATAFALSTVVSLGVLFGLGVYDLTSRTLIPLGGMVIGNSISASILVARRIVDSYADKRAEIEARLALGLSARMASQPYLVAALRTAFIPQIETTKAVGIVFLPGALVGLVLAGVDPAEAVLVQAAVMYMILGSVATTTTVIALGLSRRLFSDDHRLL